MSTTLLNYSFTQDNDQVQITEVLRVDVASGSAAQMASRALATLGTVYAIGATRYGTSVKVYNRGVQHVEGVHHDVTVMSRTEQFDDLIMNSASGTDIDKGFNVESESGLREMHPTSGAFFLLGQWQRYKKNSEPRLGVWFERIHDTPPFVAARTLVGAVNSSTFLGVTSPLLWLCNSVETHTVRTDSGQRYLSRYSFSYKAEGWNWKTAAYLWNSRTLGSITAATSATGEFTLFKDVSFATYGFSIT